MKKILLLILTSLVLFACQKEDTEPVANGEPVTQEYTCPNCGAKYSVTCKEPYSAGKISVISDGDDWTPITDPSGGKWTVKDESGQNVPHYEASQGYCMYFICTCEKKSKEFKKNEFRIKTATVK